MTALLLAGCAGPPAHPPGALDLRPDHRYVELVPHSASELRLDVRGGRPSDPLDLQARGLPPGTALRAGADRVTFTSLDVQPGAYAFTLTGRKGPFVHEVPLQLYVPTTGPFALEPARPVDVTVKTDVPLSVTGQVTPAGGTLNVTGPDGVQYTLNVPPGAVLEPTPVRLTPVTGVDWSGFSASRGVRIEPDDLQLWKPARVDVTFPSKPAGAGIFRAFGAQGAGRDLFLKEVAVRDLTATLSVTRGGVGGVGWVLPEALEDPPIPSAPEARRSERLARFATVSEGSHTERMYEWTLNGRLTGAGAPSSEGAQALSTLLREVAVWNTDLQTRRWSAAWAGNAGLLWAHLAELAVAQVGPYQARCLQGGTADPAWTAELVHWQRAAAVLPAWQGALGPEGLRDLTAALNACR
ncbi:hypothetical protein [Deinococcus sonorensis]|uniref:Lipoprotein n=2 Tax=Deinococcus sonorensis TaxID=309891 RepID=A0AAU7U6J9_9DEIO